MKNRIDKLSLKEKKKRLYLSMAILAEMIMLMILLIVLMQNKNSTAFFSDFANAYGIIVGNLTSLLPFSLFELGVIIFIIISLILIINFFIKLKKKNTLTAIRKIIGLFSFSIFVICLYMSTASFSYKKNTVFLGFENSHEYSFETVKKSVGYHFDKFNYLAEKLDRNNDGSIKFPYSQKELAKKIRAEYQKSKLNFLYDFVPMPKPIVNSWFMTETFILGISFMPTVEPNYNINTPPADLPHTIAHEIAHSLGVMTEYDANYIATYILLNSDDEYLQYSAYFNSLYLFSGDLSNSFNDDLNRFDEEIASLMQVSPKIRIEQNLYSLFWTDNYGFMAKIGNFFNDLYLKLSGVNDGDGSYQEPPTPPDGNNDEDLVNMPFSRYQKMFFEHFLSR